MSEHTDLIAEIDELRARKEAFARRAMLLERRCRGLREDNPRDPRIRELSIQIDALDEWHDRMSDEIGRKHARLWEIEAGISLREKVADAAYGRTGK